MVYIKRIEIRGFKSYKDQTMVEPFSPQHNVIGTMIANAGSSRLSSLFWIVVDVSILLYSENMLHNPENWL